MNTIEVDGLCVEYADGNQLFTALDHVSFTVRQGEFVSVIGASGCGKSTLLRTLGGLRAPDSGVLTINGKPLTGPGEDRAFVFQHYSLFPWMTARNNIAFAIKQIKKPLSKNERLSIADDFLEKVGLRNVGNKYPAQLSGGMRQRVAIARSLALDAEILLMDEPFGAVDAKNRSILQELLLRLWEGIDEEDDNDVVYPFDGATLTAAPLTGKQRKTVVFVTHDIDEAILLSDRIIMMASNPGRILRELTIPFARPHKREMLAQTEEYTRLRKELLALFFDDYGRGI
ncbi:MAG: ABC transporter ATP-binding protein [Spirochaetaceae bacterium]|jgi:NitT/TauT family transport system ATP-binding protein|nr:ABC transporter ATP-binding protein [Spirochaetaceae bacterium]